MLACAWMLAASAAQAQGGGIPDTTAPGTVPAVAAQPTQPEPTPGVHPSMPRRTQTAPARKPRAVAPSRNEEACVDATGRGPYAQRDDVKAFARELSAQFADLGEAATLSALAQACYRADVARLIMPAPNAQARNWAAYRARFVESEHIRAGAAFWAANHRWLTIAEQRYGVPAEVIVGILGVETFYGRQTGNFRVLDALATLAFDFPGGRSDRSAFFREQLGDLLRLAQREGVDAASIRGSYAGAIGWAQFMPSSWLDHAVDFNGDSRVDLRNSLPDVIGSIANFLARHGWQSGMPARFDVEPPEDADQLALLLEPDIRPSFTHTEFEDAGAQLDEFGREHTGLLALVELRNGDAAPSYVAGTENFWALTRYNWSAYYAMAVLDLGKAIAHARGVPAAPSRPRPAATPRKPAQKH